MRKDLPPPIHHSAASQKQLNPVGMPENHILRVYNQFPRRYQYSSGVHDGKSVIERMIDDLPRIAEMGFNAIWVNPLQRTGQFAFRGRGQDLSGSLYAMADDNELNADFFPTGMLNSDREVLLRRYVVAAKSYGLSPLFDLVLRHVSHDVWSAVTTGKIRRDFERRCNGYLTIPEKKRWKDVSAFRTDQSDINHLMQHIFEPFIKKYIGVYGFEGVRVDAVISTSPRLQQRALECVQTCAQNYHQHNAILLGEVMAKDPQAHINKLRTIGFTHVFFAGSYYHNFTEIPQGDNWLYDDLSLLQHLTQKRGGLVGFGGNHDVGTLKSICLLEAGKFGDRNFGFLKSVETKPNLNKHDPEILQRMVDKLFCTALMPNGGYYLLAGDEFGLMHRPLVFEHYREPIPVRNRWGGQEDLRVFVKNINVVLAQLPCAREGDTVKTDIILLENQSIRYLIRQSGADQSISLVILTACPEISFERVKNMMAVRMQKMGYGPPSKVFILSNNGATLSTITIQAKAGQQRVDARSDVRPSPLPK